MREFDDFMEIVRKIRRNCPWDSVQTHESLKKYLLEESNEVLEGIDRLSKKMTAQIFVRNWEMCCFRWLFTV